MPPAIAESIVSHAPRTETIGHEEIQPALSQAFGPSCGRESVRSKVSSIVAELAGIRGHFRIAELRELLDRPERLLDARVAEDIDDRLLRHLGAGLWIAVPTCRAVSRAERVVDAEPLRQQDETGGGSP